MNASSPCRHLRTKKLYIPAEADEAFDMEANATGACGHCWCSRTMAEVGPDDRQVQLTLCVQGRSCYQE